MRKFAIVAATGTALLVSACSGMSSQEQKVVSGGAIGAGTAITGGCVSCGAAIGGAVGAGAGYVKDKMDKND